MFCLAVSGEMEINGDNFAKILRNQDRGVVHEKLFYQVRKRLKHYI